MDNRFSRLLQVCLLGLDLLFLNVIIMMLHFELERIESVQSMGYARLWFVLNSAWIFICWAGNVYHEKYILSFELFTRRTMQAFCYWLAAVLLYLFFARQFELSRFYIAIVVSVFAISLMVNRIFYLFVRTYFKRTHKLERRIIIIGYNETSKKLVSYLEEESIHTEIVGFCEEPENVMELTHYPVISAISGVMEISKQYKVTEIYSTISPEQDRGIYQFMQQADDACIRFKLIPDLSFFINRAVHIDYLKDMPVLSLRNEPLTDTANRIRKRLFDIVVSLLVIVCILSWLVPLLSLLIWFESYGPAFFSQLRSGKNNEPFACYKFRSMKVNNDADKKQATKNDDRITRMGRFMRRTSLDEFPQFFNVLKGDMSIVGPRPHMLKHTDDYSKLIGQYMVRQFLKPGITGWAQVNGYRGETKTLEQMQRRVEYDIWYMENWSVWLDIRIMFLTVYNTVQGEENAF